jgi:hypothetical protein
MDRTFARLFSITMRTILTEHIAANNPTLLATVPRRTAPEESAALRGFAEKRVGLPGIAAGPAAQCDGGEMAAEGDREF